MDHVLICAADTHMKTSRESASIELISRLQKPIPVPETPCTESVPDPEREVYQGNNLQKVIKRHATQTVV